MVKSPFRATVLGLATLVHAAVVLGQPAKVAAVATDFDVDLYGTVYLLDAASATITVLSAELEPQSRIGGQGWDENRFDQPSGIWARNGLDIFVADFGNHRVQRFDRQMAFVSSLSARDNENADVPFGYPADVALSRQGELYVIDGDNKRILKVKGAATVEKSFGGFDAGRGALETPSRLAVGPGDRVYVIDGSRIKVFDAFGNFLRGLYDELWEAPSAIWGDPDRIIVADGETLTMFDTEERKAWRVRVGDLVAGVDRKLLAIGWHRGKLYLLDGKELRVVQEPHGDLY